MLSQSLVQVPVKYVSVLLGEGLLAVLYGICEWPRDFMGLLKPGAHEWSMQLPCI